MLDKLTRLIEAAKAGDWLTVLVLSVGLANDLINQLNGPQFTAHVKAKALALGSKDDAITQLEGIVSGAGGNEKAINWANVLAILLALLKIIVPIIPVVP